MSPTPGPQDNIKVFVRCRPKSDKEIRDHTPDILHFDAVQSRELDVKDNRGTNKRYTFDKVFSPIATQEIVYHEVARPILREVLEGYNCTIFAYGQTGTGKTFTMEGDISMPMTSIKDPIPVNAGLIPRTLVRLFEEMYLSQLDYTIKLSCMELYNEELYDLLAIHSNAKPVSLNLFKDQSGSITAKGLEEAIVENAADAMRKVSDANAKRRVAATALNAVSSRSHCIFSITVVMRETTLAGEELVKTGKLNLVDLAGSENVSRSRAQDLQLREASMINKSLFNLGRVINALVRRDNHVPYRDSKLTRLLSESLGGRAKTAIIATVSPATCNSEETLSTLDYAQRAKNIQNRPEVNTKINKKAVLQEFSHEIRQLRDQLRCQREKDNGAVYLPGDQYTALVAMKQEYQVLLESHDQIVQLKNAEMVAEREAHGETRAEVTKVRRAWFDTKALLDERALQVAKLAVRTKEDRTVLMCVSQREAVLRSLMHDLIRTLDAAASDVCGLHETVLLARNVVGSNNAEMNAFRGELVAEMKVLANKLAEFDLIQTKLGASIEQQVDMLDHGTAEYHRDIGAQYDQLSSSMASQMNDISAQLQAYSDHPLTDPIRKLMTQLRSEFVSATQAFETVHQSHTAHQIAELQALATSVQDSYKDLQVHTGNVFQSLARHFAQQHEQLGSVQCGIETFVNEATLAMERTRDMAHAHGTRVTEQSTRLGENLACEISRMISGYVTSRNTEVLQGIDQVGSSIASTADQVREFGSTMPSAVAQIALAAEAARMDAGRAGPELESALASACTAIRSGVDGHRALVACSGESVTSNLAQLDEVVERAAGAVYDGLAQVEACRSDTVARMAECVSGATGTVVSSVGVLKTRTDAVREVVAGVAQWCRNNTMVSNCKMLVSRFTQQTQSVEASAEHFTRKRLRDPETIPVPSKRAYHGPACIPPPLNRDQILRQAPQEHGGLGEVSDPAALVDPDPIDVTTPKRPHTPPPCSPPLPPPAVERRPTPFMNKMPLVSGIPVPLSPASSQLKYLRAQQQHKAARGDEDDGVDHMDCGPLESGANHLGTGGVNPVT